MKYAIIFGTVSLMLLAGGAIHPDVRWILVWSALSFGWIAAGYAGLGSRVFGKRANGTMPLLLKILNLPYLMFTWGTWHMLRLLSREAPYNRVDENLVIGRRLMGNEVPDTFDWYVDLTAEFEEPRDIRELANYRCLPILDAGVPTPEHLRQALLEFAGGRIYVHCAQGHGRTGIFALALLLHRGTAKTVEEGMTMLRNARPALGLNREQVDFIQRYASEPREGCVAK